MSDRKITLGSFSLERTYPASISRVFKAFSDNDAKTQWFGPSSEEWTPLERSFDFRVGGKEVNIGQHGPDAKVEFYATYFDIIEDERIVSTYEMYINGNRISVSLATVELMAVEGGTQVVWSESGAFLDGFDEPNIREHGTAELMDRITATLI